MRLLHLIAVPSRPLRTVHSQSLIRDSPRLPALSPRFASSYDAYDGSDQGQARESKTNNNGDFVLLEEALKTKWIRILELECATDDLSLWRWIHGVKTVLLEAFRANV